MLSAAVLITALSAVSAAAQTPDARWNDWLGCWSLVADGNVARLPPAEDAAGGVTGPIRPGSSRSARVCVSPNQGGAELRTLVGEQQVLSQTIIADGADHRVNDGGCTGTQRARWSDDGRRLFTRAQVTCDGQPSRTVTGLALIAPDGDWVDVQAVTIGDTDSVRVRRYRPPVEQANKGVPAAAVRLQIEHVKEATRYVSPRAIEAALMETSARFPLSSRALVDLDKAGVDDRVIDLMVALSYPRSFAIRPSGPDDRLTPFPPFLPGADFIDASYEYPYFYGPYYSNYYYSPYFFSPFGYSYLRYYGGGFSPVAVIVPGENGGGGAGPGRNLPPENGRVINGKGYTVVDRRGDVASSGGSGGGEASTRSGSSSRGTVSPRGYTGGDASSGATSSSSSGGSSSGGGASSAGSSGGDGGRTAVPR
jgi:hypothetical protein